MATNTYKNNAPKKKKQGKSGSFKFKPGFVDDKRFQISLGFFLLVSSFFLITAFISYLFTGKADQSIIEGYTLAEIRGQGLEVENWFGLLGAYAADLFIFNWFGVASFLLPPLLFVLGYFVLFKKALVPIHKAITFAVFFMLWLSTLLGYLTLDPTAPEVFNYIAGGAGFEFAFILNGLLGWGTFLALMLFFLIFLVYFFNITSLIGLSSTQKQVLAKQPGDFSRSDEEIIEEENWKISDTDNQDEVNADLAEDSESGQTTDTATHEFEIETTKPTSKKPVNSLDLEVEIEQNPSTQTSEGPTFSIEEDRDVEKKSETLENYDPTLDLGNYHYPTLDLLEDHRGANVQVTKEELEQNKDKIVETLTNFKIGISSIKATIGPTVTLYEIVPDPGIKISKIKNLGDDIALSLAALGIRIIAPIPGKGTIGIEVPNKNREMVSVKSVLSTEKFTKSKHELPVILGKTISNEVYVTDLAKMPHILMAGATGQGKSVGLNVLLASLLYKKHPSQLKLVLVDPKKVELTLFNKIERHFLAKLPNNEEAIITGTKHVIYTLNSLCIEMDNRLSLLKDAGCRNLKEYNVKFVNRRLNPEKGHRYMPYIVLVIDELADLMVTAGKEIETPISRLAAVARAIGIHLVLATQRPSVNVITGVIKANFPARMSYRVTSKIDSRTILDMGGADQLVGMGDMLFSHGSELIRLQCPYIDTEEVNRLCEFIGDQRGYPSAYMLPEFEGEEESAPGETDLGDKDSMFDEAARLIVRHQQGSTSLIQRKLKLGYNRAGRLIDQLEAAGIVGPFEGSKAREVLVTDEYSLEQLLNEINEKY
jgi:S-DNA-T family DNA segregation ATPase FtsK/SpoIIIE